MKHNYIILSLTFLAFLAVSCGKQPEEQVYEPYDTHPYWTDSNPEAFWDKQPYGGFQIDTVWDGDTTINF